jgi:3-phosphoshikimate 1-carboxyvinyltransferase
MNVVSRKTILSGSLSVPGSKSHTIRAGIFAALASGTSVIRNPLPSADCLSCLDAISAFGARVERLPGVWKVTAPEGGLAVPSRVVDVGDSGSVLYFMTPVAATLPGWTVMTGDASICTRPVDGLLEALRSLGAEAFTTRPDSASPPAVVRGPFVPGRVEMEGNLSQQVSGLMMAAPRLSGKTVIDLRNPKEKPFLLMTCRWLESVGIRVVYDEAKLDHFEVTGPQRYERFDRVIPSDWEGVAFPLVAAVITGSTVTVEGVDCSGSQGDEAIVGILNEMGADVELDSARGALVINGGGKGPGAAKGGPGSGNGGHPVRLAGGTFNCAGFPDAVPSLAVAACFAEGDTTLTDIGVCRLKETDRITLMREELAKLGASCDEGPDWLTIHGTGGRGLHGGDVESHEDHRIAMALAVAGLAIPGSGVTVRGAECCAVSFPGFYDIMNGIGAGFSRECPKGEAEQ